MKAHDITEEIFFLLSEEEVVPTEEEQQAIDLISFSTYCAALDTLVLTESIDYTLEESFVDDLKSAASHIAGKASQVVSRIISDAKEFIPKIAHAVGAEIGDLLKAFKDQSIFNLLKTFGFSFHKMLKALLALTGAIRDGLLKIFGELHKLGIFQKLRSGLIKVDEVFEKYPRLKKVGGVAVAGLLFYMWCNMTFIGDLHYDFDWSTLAAALHGSYSLADLFGSPQGLMLLTLFTTGVLSGGALSVPWLVQTPYNIILAVMYTGLLKAKEHDLAGKVKKLIHG